MVCQARGAEWYSAAAERMAASGRACPECDGGPLVQKESAGEADDERGDCTTSSREG